MTRTISPTHKKLLDIVRDEPEWGQPALLRYCERFKAGERGEASAKKWRDERAEAEAAHLAGSARS